MSEVGDSDSEDSKSSHLDHAFLPPTLITLKERYD